MAIPWRSSCITPSAGVWKYVMYCTCMRCAATQRGPGLSIRCIRSQLFSCGLHRQPQQCLWTKRLLDRRHRGCFPEKYELASATNVLQLLPTWTRESAIWTSSSRKVSFLPTWLESSIRFHPTAFYELCSVNQDDLGFGGFFWRCKPASLKKKTYTAQIRMTWDLCEMFFFTTVLHETNKQNHTNPKSCGFPKKWSFPRAPAKGSS